jgi:hypothetical protein
MTPETIQIGRPVQAYIYNTLHFHLHEDACHSLYMIHSEAKRKTLTFRYVNIFVHYILPSCISSVSL